ncbi:hypothetical protein DMB92_02410 [Campylobacter sp. MIT 99-7217]|uniref:hypothetical protein n=1 Tax=Campylobacter sp. MIT 99-7217 TaxID=535091 RepID=UPI00115A4CED|nr:hypothetical protein [Campylobacter sp. MIT 99-7217]TQR33756.1 hypothetical protein DMB92_02410 [Campylobacter sp. MIT 99-7217]
MATYTCKYCGAQSCNSSFARNSCSKSPTKSHVLMSATEKLAKYTCVHCGGSSGVPSFARNSCSKSPTKTHELLG